MLAWLEERTGLGAWARDRLLPPRLPRSADSWLALGGVLLFLLALQLGTGSLLLLHFTPHTDHAFESVRRIMRDIPFGWLIRLLHVHGANWLVIVLFVHLFRSALRGAYKQPRELVWMSGCALFGLVLVACVTGYILPWSQLSYWATTVVTATIGYVPLVGTKLMHAVRGGPQVGPATLSRAFATHVVWLPLGLAATVALHFTLLRRAGLAPSPRRRGAQTDPEPSVAFCPSFALRYAITIVGVSILLFAGIVFAPNLFSSAESFAAANPFETPPHLKPEWYLLWSYELPRLVPACASLAIQATAVAALFALPFLDRSPHRHPRDRPRVVAALLLVFAALVGLSLLGALA